MEKLQNLPCYLLYCSCLLPFSLIYINIKTHFRLNSSKACDIHITFFLQIYSPLSGRIAQREKKINQFSLWEMFWGYFCDSKLPRMKFNNQPFLRCQLAHTAHSAKFGGCFCLCTTSPRNWLVV